MFRPFRYFLVLMAALVLVSCHTTRRASLDLNGASPEKARFEAVVKGSYKYDALQSKVRLNMGKTGLNGKMCIEHGKRFALSANAPLLGFELGRIEACGDTLYLVDKYDKYYCALSLADMTEIPDLAGHELEALECLMLGRIFIPGRGEASSRDYSRLAWQTPALADGKLGNSLGVFEGRNYRLIYEIDGRGQLVSTTLALADGKEATFRYDGREELQPQRVVATNESVSIVTGQKSVKAGFVMNNPSFGPSTWKSFEPSSSYRRVTLDELMEVLKRLM